MGKAFVVELQELLENTSMPFAKHESLTLGTVVAYFQLFFLSSSTVVCSFTLISKRGDV